MTEITRKITVDLARRGNSRLIFARQNDFNSRKIVINLTNAGVPFWVEKSCSVLVNFLRPDGESAAFYGSVEDDGSVSIILGSWQLAVVGEVKCSVSIFSDIEQKLTSADFYLDVETALYTGDEISADENYSILVGLLSEMSNINHNEDARKDAEESRQSAEISRDKAETQRKNNEVIRDGCEVVRIEAETERSEAENERVKAESERSEAESARTEAEKQRAAAESARVAAEEERNNFIGDLDAIIEKIILLQQQIIDGGVDIGGVA